ncbi:S8 family serine peptidase [uncultured Paraglaciecola sp.]|uniref:S8 family serine peptidase n=1 Tax=uncultured Paraglaciecola sp. TaxID=1765024 RepID=UPI0025E68BF3|nr:S8 family serine peptidase [uncultured Paraglaciecola sp.]
MDLAFRVKMKHLVLNKAMLVGIVSLIGSVSAVVLSNGHTTKALNTESKNIEVTQIAVTQVAQEKSYILQGLSLTGLVKAVEHAGGMVSREFPIINAISALLTSDQVSLLASTTGLRVMEDRTVLTESVSKKFIIDTNITTQINANSAHDMGITGHGVTVAVLDSGMLLDGTKGAHLLNNTIGNNRVLAIYDAILGNKTNSLNTDKNGHGTHISGIIASSLEDEFGNYNGIAPNANLISVKAFDNNGVGSYSDTLDGLNWIYKNRRAYNIRVLNLSLGAEVRSNYWNDPINQAVMKLWNAGVVVVTSAGNSGSDYGSITVPGNNPYVITVGAITDSYTPYV